MKYEVRKTEPFKKWLVKLKDATAKKRLLARLDMASNGHFGDHKQLD
jgi:putative addiction module killer protein